MLSLWLGRPDLDVGASDSLEFCAWMWWHRADLPRANSFLASSSRSWLHPTLRGVTCRCVLPCQPVSPSKLYQEPSVKTMDPTWHLSDLGVHMVEAQVFQRKASTSSRSRFRGTGQETPGSQVSGVWFRRARGFWRGTSPRPTDFSPRGKGWGGRKPRAKPSGERGQSRDFLYPSVTMVLEPAIGLSQPGST